MKITKEQFNNLKQNDRIEYLQHEILIDSDYTFGIMVSAFLALFAIGILALPQIVSHYQIMFSYFDLGNYYMLLGFSKLIAFIVLIVSFIIGFLSLVNYSKNSEKLKEKFFKEEVKPKNGK